MPAALRNGTKLKQSCCPKCQTSMIKKITLSIFFALLFLAAAGNIFRSVQRGFDHNLSWSMDFGMRWASVKGILHGENVYEMALNKTPSKYIQKLFEDNKILAFDPQYLPSSLFPIIPFLQSDMLTRLFRISYRPRAFYP